MVKIWKEALASTLWALNRDFSSVQQRSVQAKTAILPGFGLEPVTYIKQCLTSTKNALTELEHAISEHTDAALATYNSIAQSRGSLCVPCVLEMPWQKLLRGACCR